MLYTGASPTVSVGPLSTEGIIGVDVGVVGFVGMAILVFVLVVRRRRRVAASTVDDPEGLPEVEVKALVEISTADQGTSLCSK